MVLQKTRGKGGDVENVGLGIGRGWMKGRIRREEERKRTDFPSSFDLSELNKSITSPIQCFTNRISSLGLSLGSDDCGLSLLFGLFNDEFSTFSILLCDLFLFDCGSEFFTESGLLALGRHEGVGRTSCVSVLSAWSWSKMRKLTIDTSSSMMLNSLARFRRSSLIRADTISRFVMSSEAARQLSTPSGTA